MVRSTVHSSVGPQPVPHSHSSRQAPPSSSSRWVRCRPKNQERALNMPCSRSCATSARKSAAAAAWQTKIRVNLGRVLLF